jgi:hypothetical protein
MFRASRSNFSASLWAALRRELRSNVAHQSRRIRMFQAEDTARIIRASRSSFSASAWWLISEESRPAQRPERVRILWPENAAPDVNGPRE